VGPWLGQGPQARLCGLQLFDHFEKIADAPSQPVKARNDKRVTKPGRLYRLGEFGAGAPCRFDIDHAATGRLKLLSLFLDGKAPRRWPHISNKHLRSKSGRARPVNPESFPKDRDKEKGKQRKGQ
ncbi:MAG TPA: hypothetical protein PKZ97_16940, partial [Azospirillaceae bacterium]|nr:hypothetical protein [Azospirillaceae bacterium]